MLMKSTLGNQNSNQDHKKKNFLRNNQDFADNDYFNEDQKIVGGKRAIKGQFPYQV